MDHRYQIKTVFIFRDKVTLHQGHNRTLIFPFFFSILLITCALYALTPVLFLLVGHQIRGHVVALSRPKTKGLLYTRHIFPPGSETVKRKHRERRFSFYQICHLSALLFTLTRLDHFQLHRGVRTGADYSLESAARVGDPAVRGGRGRFSGQGGG